MATSMKPRVGSSLSLPNVKLLSYHLQVAVPSLQIGDRKYWEYSYNRKIINFSIAWVQGLVVNVDIDKEEVVIKDDTGKIKLVETRMNPATIEDMYILKPGQYVMAIGDLIDNKNMAILLTRKLKILDNGSDELLALWPLEVKHQLKYAAIPPVNPQ